MITKDTVHKSLTETFSDFLKPMAEEFASTAAKVVFLLDTYNLWSEDGTYTFPDGDVLRRDEWRSQ